MVSFVGFFLHFARLTNIVLISPPLTVGYSQAPPRQHAYPVQLYISDKLSTVFRIINGNIDAWLSSRATVRLAPTVKKTGIVSLKPKTASSGSGTQSLVSFQTKCSNCS